MRAAADNIVKIWSPATGELIRNMTGHTKGLSDIAWSPDSVYLASASDDTTVRIWDVDSVRLRTLCISSIQLVNRSLDIPDCCAKGLSTKTCKGHTSFVFCLNYNTAGTQLVSGGCDGDIRIWNPQKGPFCGSLCLGHTAVPIRH